MHVNSDMDDNFLGVKKVNLAKVSMLSEIVRDWKGWLKEGSFYVHGLVYMLVRIAVNVTMVRNSKLF